MKNSPETQPRTVVVQCARIESVRIYEVQETELDQIAVGSSGGLFLVFGVFFLSSGLSFFAALITGTFSSSVVFQVLVIITAVSLIAAVVLLSLWWRKRDDVAGVISKIRGRIKA